jgi:hypothetical protein
MSAALGPVSRRAVLAGIAGTGVGLAAGGLAPRALAATGVTSADEIWEWQQRLVDFGTRYTGSRGHDRFVEWLAARFEAVPGLRLHTDRLTFHRWLARDYGLTIRQPATLGASGPVPVTYYYPYSGTTSRAGVTGRLVDLGTYTPAVPGTSGTGYTPEFWAPAKDAIALVRVPPSTFPLTTGQTPTGGFMPGRTSAEAAAAYAQQQALVTNPAFQGIFAAVPLLDARNAGVRAVVCVWTGMPDEEVANQYNPFITPYPNAAGKPVPGDPGCPALWVGDRTGQALQRSARSGQAEVTLTLTARITPHAATDTLWGVIKGSGSTGESLLVNTHTDGPNATEENGALGMLAMARHFARVRRNRDLCFVMVTGHFQLPQFTRTLPTPRPEVGNDATSVWLTDHPGWAGRSVAGVTVEHLGCTRWGNDPATGAYGRMPGYEWGATYTCRRTASTAVGNTEESAYLAAVRAVNRTGHPFHPVATLQPGAVPVYLGEGAPLYAAGMGTVSLIPAPPYLLQAGERHRPRRLNLDQLDKRLQHAQILALTRTLRALDRAPSSAL